MFEISLGLLGLVIAFRTTSTQRWIVRLRFVTEMMVRLRWRRSTGLEYRVHLVNFEDEIS